MAFAFENLLVYQKAITFADAVCTITRDLPRGYFFLGDQLSRAALSIAANIAEGNGRFTTRQGLLKPDGHLTLKENLEEIARMLSGLINGLENRKV
jgi:hypothetical protein